MSIIRLHFSLMLGLAAKVVPAKKAAAAAAASSSSDDSSEEEKAPAKAPAKVGGSMQNKE